MRVETYENHGSDQLSIWARWDTENQCLTTAAKEDSMTGQMVSFCDPETARKAVLEAISSFAQTLANIDKHIETADFKRFVATEPNPINVAQKGVDPNLIVGD